ncbi:hypothetical protein F4825DRAFT_461695 [Nemania diffusa]|nr:hypothetical protein F4825DRAFT_461695 [Nemania diffusa]
MAEERPPGDVHSDVKDQDGSGERRERVVRSLGMPEDEWVAREQRRTRFLRYWDEEHGDNKESNNTTPELIGGQTAITTETGAYTLSQEPPVVEADGQARKPWESLVIGDLGENLSHIERKNREIEQQRYIVEYHEEHSPHQVEHNRRILDQLIEERNEIEDNEENNMPQDQREKRERISRRLELLRWSLGTSRCEDESINIRAAIQGYESGQIPYSYDFTLLYRGRIVDKCPTYESFCVDRGERLDRYFAAYGPGWLWQEPPLAGSKNDILAKKGICLDRNSNQDAYKVGSYRVNLEFTVQRSKVSRGAYHSIDTKKRKWNIVDDHSADADASCQLGTLLDSGATFPIILESDLARLNIDVFNYPAQGSMDLTTVGVCSNEGSSLVGLGDKAVWPEERRTLGGFCPVIAFVDPQGNTDYTHRLSGMLPFDACYLSSAPSMARIWLGEDRRDVLGTSRLPAHLRFDSDKEFIFEYPEEFEALRREAHTPDRVIFLHEYPDKPNVLFTDSDALGARGKSELAIGQYETIDSRYGHEQPRRARPKQIIQVEPRKGGVKIVPREDPRPWGKSSNIGSVSH